MQSRKKFILFQISQSQWDNIFCAKKPIGLPKHPKMKPNGLQEHPKMKPSPYFVSLKFKTSTFLFQKVAQNVRF
jgi:hypothetical protein